MSGETDLPTLLAGLRPRLSDCEYAFATLPHGQPIPATLHPIATFHEAEGVSIIAPAAELAGTDIEHSTGWAWIALDVHSSLAAVGMMAALSRALADDGISVNAVAGYYHDHIFVQWNRRHDAVALLNGLTT